MELCLCVGLCLNIHTSSFNSKIIQECPFTTCLHVGVDWISHYDCLPRDRKILHYALFPYKKLNLNYQLSLFISLLQIIWNWYYEVVSIYFEFHYKTNIIISPFYWSFPSKAVSEGEALYVWLVTHSINDSLTQTEKFE